MKRALLVFAFVAGAVGACGSDKPAARPVKPSATVDASTGARPPLPLVSGADPDALAQLLAAAAAAAIAPMQAPGAADDVERGLREASEKHAAGMTPDGEIAKGTLSEGGHLGFIVKMEPTKCYTILAYGAGIEDLDLFMLLPPFYNLLGAHDVSTGSVAVIGGAPKMCPISPIAVPYKVDMHARKGGGAVAAQVFSQPK